MDASLITTLSELNGVSGNETAVRRFITEKIKPYANEITTDSMGNIIALKKGADASKTLAVTANMDEPGFIVKKITEKGYLKFGVVGRVDPRKLVSKKVVIGDGVKGVIGMKAIHLQNREERENVVKADKLFIDIGAENKEDAEKRVKIGDYAVFCTEARKTGENIKGKALDRSVCCAVLIEALKREYPYNVYVCFTVQHEVGSRGAKIIAHRLNADAVLTVSSSDTVDMYGKKADGAYLGKGAVINYADNTVIADKRLTKRMAEEAKKTGILCQEKVLKPFSSDAGVIQYNATPLRCLSLSVPCRYSHSPVSIVSLKDAESASAYIQLFLNKIGDMI